MVLGQDMFIRDLALFQNKRSAFKNLINLHQIPQQVNNEVLERITYTSPFIFSELVWICAETFIAAWGVLARSRRMAWGIHLI